MNSKTIIRKQTAAFVVLVVFIIALILRLHANFWSELTPGVDGMYYPLQVRHLLETGRLGFPDMPFTFWIEASLAQFIHLFTQHPLDIDILFACKLTDSIVPPLTVLPLFFLTKMISDNKMNRYFLFLILGYSVLNPSISVLLVTDFHKNAIAAVWVFVALTFLYSYLQNKSKTSLFFFLLAIILTSITHIGCFSALLLFFATFVLLIGFHSGKRLKQLFESKHKLLVGLIWLIIIAALCFSIIQFSDSERLHKMVTLILHPANFFQNSVISLMIHHQPSLQGIRMFYFIFITLCSLFSIILFFVIKRKLSPVDYRFFTAMVIWQLLLTTPFVSMEWAERIYFISYIPFTIILLYAFRFLSISGTKILAVILSAFILLFMVTAPSKRSSVLSAQEANELKSLQPLIQPSDKTIIIAKHGLEWWTAWELHTKIATSELRPEDRNHYSHIYYLRLKDGSKRPNAGIPEITIPRNAIMIADKTYFELYLDSTR